MRCFEEESCRPSPLRKNKERIFLHLPLAEHMQVKKWFAQSYRDTASRETWHCVFFLNFAVVLGQELSEISKHFPI